MAKYSVTNDQGDIVTDYRYEIKAAPKVTRRYLRYDGKLQMYVATLVCETGGKPMTFKSLGGSIKEAMHMVEEMLKNYGRTVEFAPIG